MVLVCRILGSDAGQGVDAAVAQDGSVSGLLLYARTQAAEQPNLDVVIQGNRIGARTLDLNRPWADLRAQLEDVVTWLDR